ncbi:MAG: hypothetical protein JST84_05395 [Acidobacteria bacterium]|nr:hypothetical protein [Acidobacteriota bacterium]
MTFYSFAQGKYFALSEEEGKIWIEVAGAFGWESADALPTQFTLIDYSALPNNLKLADCLLDDLLSIAPLAIGTPDLAILSPIITAYAEGTRYRHGTETELLALHLAEKIFAGSEQVQVFSEATQERKVAA